MCEAQPNRWANRSKRGMLTLTPPGSSRRTRSSWRRGRLLGDGLDRFAHDEESIPAQSLLDLVIPAVRGRTVVAPVAFLVWITNRSGTCTAACAACSAAVSRSYGSTSQPSTKIAPSRYVIGSIPAPGGSPPATTVAPTRRLAWCPAGSRPGDAGEDVTVDPPDGTVERHRSLDRHADVFEESVGCADAEPIVDLTEPVDVDTDHRKPRA